MDSFDLYQAIGGKAACRKIAVAFYARVARDSLLRPLFPGKTFRCAIEEFESFLAQFLGGPSEHTQHRWWLSLRESHQRFRIGQGERDAWMRNMEKALEDVSIEEPVRGALLTFFERSSTYVVNTGQAQTPAAVCPGERMEHEIAWRWDAQRALDEAVAAVRGGDIARAIALAESVPLDAYLNGNRAVFASLLALLIRGGERATLDYVDRELSLDPGLVRERFGGRTLLHAAAGAGNGMVVALLLRLGVDPNVQDAGGHSPLYCVGNECPTGGGTVVKMLVQAGAKVNACDGVKRCTALHMAARRGNVEAAEALLDCGAEIEARDSVGDTPLRRAVNCRKTEIAAMLLSRGANRHSMGSKGLTPILAARNGDMRRLL